MSSSYHAGEIAVQRRAGVYENAARASGGIHGTIPGAAATFLLQQRMIVLSTADESGCVWASLLTGEAGFVEVVDERTILIRAFPNPTDPLSALLKGLSRNIPVGCIAIEFATRRRMRLNGSMELTDEGHILVHAAEVYSNCPKYIQAREVASVSRLDSDTPREYRTTADNGLNPNQKDWVESADTFFVASMSGDGLPDASHRGGNPGFVHVIDSSRLEWPDYSGNMMFNTLGNIAINPRAGLLFLDFENDRLLQITGTAVINWDSRNAATFSGAQRTVEYYVEHIIEIAHAHDLRFGEPVRSPFNPVVD